ncbi:signal transduction histidine kinase [Duganella sp. 1411]|uniref:sensor histidine kinase n=1 Tax=Duganella sp. 1411 TaxID=2806572 RepID=UPI001AEB274C|nr:histidine kinase [Duganella sp. 1411]MBP1202111.1 signal transduction histidine kinase [Duganella sp. 1411]
MKRRRTRLLVAVGAWSAMGLVFAIPYLARGNGYKALLASMINWWLWGLLAPLIKKFDDRLSASGKPPLQMLAAHILFGIALPALYTIIVAPLEYVVGLNSWNPWVEMIGVLDWFLWAVLVHCVILGSLKAYQYYRHHVVDALKLERLERRFLETRLNALRMQLDPHFLFNSLNGISAYVEHEPKLARKMIEHLGDLLRLSLATRNRQEVTLAEEMAFLDHYLALHRMRFEDRLRVTLDIAPDVEQACIPSLLLQPLVENAIRHGIAGRVTGGRVSVSARRAGDRVDIRVTDDGVGLPPDWHMAAPQGLGLSVTRDRLSAMYSAEEYEFDVGRHASGGTEARISLPFAI